MTKNTELEHAKSLIDVVFGVLIALPLTEVLPPLVNDVIVVPQKISLWVSLFLLISALVFTAFYWVEVRRFINWQIKIDNIIGENLGLSLSRFVGSLIMFGLVAATLKFANDDRFRPFVIANILFWAFDFVGNIEFKKRYRRENIAKLLENLPKNVEEYDWLTGRNQGKRFIKYSIVNMLFFGLILVCSYIFLSVTFFKFVAATLILFLTLYRHLYWRPKIENWFV